MQGPPCGPWPLGKMVGPHGAASTAGRLGSGSLARVQQKRCWASWRVSRGWGECVLTLVPIPEREDWVPREGSAGVEQSMSNCHRGVVVFVHSVRRQPAVSGLLGGVKDDVVRRSPFLAFSTNAPQKKNAERVAWAIPWRGLCGDFFPRCCLGVQRGEGCAQERRHPTTCLAGDQARPKPAPSVLPTVASAKKGGQPGHCWTVAISSPCWKTWSAADYKMQHC